MTPWYDGSMDMEEFKQLLRDQTESLIGTMEVMLQQNKLDTLDHISASEHRLMEKLASKEELRDHERRIVRLEEVAG